MLVRKNYEAGLVETCSPKNCDVGLLAYSPLAAGVLSGKYNRESESELVSSGARLTLFPGFMGRYKNGLSKKAVDRYEEVAAKYGLTLTQLALAWVYKREFVSSSIIGATTMEQLEGE